MANKMCNWYDKFFMFIGKLGLICIILYLLYRFAFKPYFTILKIPLANQLGI